MGTAKIHLICAPTWCDTQDNAPVAFSLKKKKKKYQKFYKIKKAAFLSIVMEF